MTGTSATRHDKAPHRRADRARAQRRRQPRMGSGLAWVDTLAPAPADGLDVSGFAADPVGTACRAELRRIGHALHAANPDEDIVALQVEVAEIDPTHAGWRTMVLEMA